MKIQHVWKINGNILVVAYDAREACEEHERHTEDARFVYTLECLGEVTNVGEAGD